MLELYYLLRIRMPGRRRVEAAPWKRAWRKRGDIFYGRVEPVRVANQEKFGGALA